jgi:signal peptidase I
VNKPRLKIVVSSICLATMAVLLLGRSFLIDYYRIPQNGMSPGLPAGSLVFAYKLAYSAPSQVQRGDIIVFSRPVEGRPYNYIWRVIGLPGDKIEAAGESLSVNGQAVKRDRVREDADSVIFQEAVGDASYEICVKKAPENEPPDASLAVPPDSFFVMGDNRFGAVDSRYFGPIPFSTIIGRKL